MRRVVVPQSKGRSFYPFAASPIVVSQGLGDSITMEDNYAADIVSTNYQPDSPMVLSERRAKEKKRKKQNWSNLRWKIVSSTIRSYLIPICTLLRRTCPREKVISTQGSFDRLVDQRERRINRFMVVQLEVESGPLFDCKHFISSLTSHVPHYHGFVLLRSTSH